MSFFLKRSLLRTYLMNETQWDLPKISFVLKRHRQWELNETQWEHVSISPISLIEVVLLTLTGYLNETEWELSPENEWVRSK